MTGLLGDVPGVTGQRGRNLRLGVPRAQISAGCTEVVTAGICDPEGPSTQALRTLVPNTIKGMVLEPESLNIGYLDPVGEAL